MEGEKIFTQSKEIKKENPLLKGSDLIDCENKFEVMHLPEIEIKHEKGEVLLSILFKGYNSGWGGHEHELNGEIVKHFEQNPLSKKAVEFLNNIKALEDGGIDEEALYEIALTYDSPERIAYAKEFIAKYKSYITNFENLREGLISVLRELDLLLSENLRNQIQLAESEDINKRIENIEKTKGDIQNLIDFFRPSPETTKIRKITILPTDFLYHEQSGTAFEFGDITILRSHIDNPSNLEHEFLHSVINPITEKLSEQLTEEQKQKIIDLSSQRLIIEEGYGNHWESLLNEELIRTYNEVIEQGSEFLSYEKFVQIIDGISESEFQVLLKNDEKLRERCNQLLISDIESLKQKSSQYYKKFGESKLREIMYNFYRKYIEKKADENLNFEQFVLSEFKNVL